MYTYCICLYIHIHIYIYIYIHIPYPLAVWRGLRGLYEVEAVVAHDLEVLPGCYHYYYYD